MVKKLSFRLFLVALLNSTCLAATNDSLISVADTHSNHIEAFKIYLKLTNYYKDSNPDSAFVFAKKAVTRAQLEKENRALAFAENYLGQVFFELRQTDSSLAHLKKAVYYAKLDTNYSLMASFQLTVGEVYRKIGAYSKAFEYWNFSVLYADSAENELGVARSFNNIGLLYYYLMDVDESYGAKAKSFLKQSIGLKKKNNANLASSFHNLALVFDDLGESDSAYHYARLAASENKKVNNKIWLLLNYLEASEASLKLKNLKNAKEFLDSAKNIYQSENLINYTTDISYQEGAYFLALKNYSLAKEKALLALKESKLTEDLELEVESNYLLYKIYDRMDEIDSAYHYRAAARLIENQQLKDKIQTESKQNQIEIDLTLREKQLELLEEKSRYNSLKTASIKKNNFLLTISLTLALGLVVFLVYLFIQRNKLNNIKLESIKAAAEKNKLNSILSAQEEEKNKISSALHDQIGGSLAALKLQFQQKEMDPIQSEALIDEIAIDVRNISHLLSGKKILKIGLKRAVEHLGSYYKTTALTVKIFCEDVDEYLSDEVKIELFRIVQELLTNIQKHSEATIASIQIIRDINKLIITVEDNGVGMTTNKNEGIGFGNIEDRIKYLNGDWHIDSSPKNGTSVSIQIPIID